MASSIRTEVPRRAAEMAAKLGECPVRRLAPARSGGNNRVYRIDFDDGRVCALKTYPRQDADPRDRLGTEFSTLSFLNLHDVNVVPQAISADPSSGFALYEWVEGSAVTDCLKEDIDAAIAFTMRLHELSKARDAIDLPVASEACLSGAEILSQIDRRYHRLREIAAEEAGLKAFLDNEFDPLRQRVAQQARDGYAELGMDFETEIPTEIRTLSPADFGFHNTIRRSDGELIFVDFEYFGWEDPVRLVAEFTQHPAMDLKPAMARRFHKRACALFESDEFFLDRLSFLYPPLGLRWCMILLNEFLPERWFRRIYAGERADRAKVQNRQLDKARNHLAKVQAVLDGGEVW